MKLVTLKVNDTEISVPEGTLLIDACEQNGIHIPRFCYHEGLFPSGNCRLCLVRIEKNPKLVPSCMTPVVSGMVVHTETPEIHEMRKAILEYILINHPLDCPICDKAGECLLQNQYMAYSGSPTHFKEKKIPKGKLYKFSERIIYDAERCITCTRCVRFTRDISKSNKLGVILRGDRSYVALAPGDTFDDPYSYCVTDLCPVGALTSRQYRFQERVWNLIKTESICAGCARGCNISLQQRNGKILRVMPRFNAKVNQHWMCDFGRNFYVKSTNERLRGTQIDGKPIQYNLFVQSVANLFKNHGAKIGMILSSHATNEELDAARKLCDKSGVQQIFAKSDRVWQPESGEVEQDDFLILADKTPNARGVLKIFPKALDLDQLNPAELEYLFVWGSNFTPEVPANVKVILLATTREPLAGQAHWRIAGRTPAEKSGSFTNADGVVQSFKGAVPGSDNFDDRVFLNDLIEKVS